jgi:hypothetical protein
MCYKKIGNYEESVKDYTQAIKLEGSNGNFYYNRAISYMWLLPPDYDKVHPSSLRDVCCVLIAEHECGPPGTSRLR